MMTFLKENETIVPIMRLAIIQTITTILDASIIFNQKVRDKLLE